MRASKLLTAASVMAAGICAAWPFRQPAGKLTYPPPVSIPLDLTLRALDVPLTAASASDQSPAADLLPTAGSTMTVARASSSLPLEKFSLPPELPVSFRFSAESSTAPLAPLTAVIPGGSVLDERSTRSRTYVLRDGDTLENLAERFLGSRARAAEIYEANRPQLTRPDLLPVGTTIKVPPRIKTDEAAELAER